MNKLNSKRTGFTIVELLVVIVVIGILAAITIVSYTGISQKASAVTIKSDLNAASKQLSIDSINNGSYPSSEGAANSGKGLSKSPGTIYSYSQTSGGYCLSATSTDAGTTYHISSSGGAIQDGACTLTWAQITAGGYNTCGIASNGQIYCWGKNQTAFGNGSTAQSNVPVPTDTTGLLNGKTILSVTTGNSDGYARSCAIASDNLAYCWGGNGYGDLGNNSTITSSVPVAVDTTGVFSGKTIKSLSTGSYSTCAIASDNLLYCWGKNMYGNLGINSTVDSHIPVAVNTSGVLSGKTIKSLTSGGDYVCVIASDDLAYCWGGNWYGNLGDNSTTQRNVPVAVDTTGVLNGKTVKSIAASVNGLTCAIASDDQVYCWGRNNYGQLGNNSIVESHVPVAVDTTGVLSGKTVKSITTGTDHVCAIASNDLVYCWGFNYFGNGGSLGNNSASNSSIPVAVDTTGVLNGKTVKSIAAGRNHSCAIASDNQAYCWGYNGKGQLGNNSITGSLVPVATIPVSL